MSLFNQLFGRSKGEQVLSNPDKTDAGDYKLLKCSLCEQMRPTPYNKKDGYQIMGVIGPTKAARFVGVCTKCKISICSDDVKWKRIEFSLEESKALLEFRDKFATIVKPEYKTMVYEEYSHKKVAICPKCNMDLVGKTSADLKFYGDNISELFNLLRAGKRDECKSLCLKLLTILEDEKEFLLENRITEEEYKKMFRALEQVLSQVSSRIM
jgi:hypothetical protein